MSSTNFEDFTEFTKIRNLKPDSYLKGNNRDPVLAGEFYRNSAEHLLEEIARIGLIISHFLEKSRTELCEESQAYQGLFISEAEVDSILEAVCYMPVNRKSIAQPGAG